ncbi:MAG: hypothetical protein QW567_01005 [Candidatus Hadarchaeales archaeon]
MRRDVKFTRDLEEIKLVDRSIGPFSRGDEAEVWEWDAEVFERHGIAVPARQVSVQDIRKMILLQERNSGPIALPDGFYREVRSRVENLRRAGDEKAAEELRSALMTLVEIRLPKIVLLSLSPEAAAELPAEEAFLLNRLAGEVEEWSRSVVDGKFGEEVGENGTGRAVPRNTGDEADIQE